MTTKKDPIPTSYLAQSVSGFAQFLESTFQETDDVLFRGQLDDWALVPKIGRLRARGNHSIRETERRMLDDFKRQAFALIDIRPETDWDWLSVAQHFGMATRLLDWTTNPLAALWFAVEVPARIVDGQGRNGIVWAFNASPDDYVTDPSAEGPFDGSRTRIFRPRHIARRITAQSGWFTAHKLMEKENRFIALERQARYREKLTKICVPPESFSDIRYQLDRCGVNAASLLTDLSGLCRHIEWQHSLVDDEQE